MSIPSAGPPQSAVPVPTPHEQKLIGDVLDAIYRANDALQRARDGLAVDLPSCSTWSYVYRQLSIAQEACMAGMLHIDPSGGENYDPAPSTAELVQIIADDPVLSRLAECIDEGGAK